MLSVRPWCLHGMTATHGLNQIFVCMFLFVQQKSVTLKKLFRNKDNLLMAYYSKTIQEVPGTERSVYDGLSLKVG